MKTTKYTELLKETNKAWLLDFGLHGDLWFPKSNCSINKEKKTLKMPNWLAWENLWICDNSNCGDLDISNSIEDDILGTMDWNE